MRLTSIQTALSTGASNASGALVAARPIHASPRRTLAESRLTVDGMLHHTPGQRQMDAAFRSLDPAKYELPQGLLDQAITPCLVVYLDAVRHNIAEIIRVCGGDPSRWRPHAKTTKIRAVYAELVRSGVHQFKAATPREADVLGSVFEELQVAGDVLVAFPLVGPGLVRLGQVAQRHPRTKFSVLVETLEAVAALPAGVSYFIDVNPGMHRSGMPLEAAEQGRAAEVAAAGQASGAYRGLHFYDGHGVGWVDLDERKSALWALYDRLLALDKSLQQQGFLSGELITAGTPSLTSSISHKSLAATGRHRVSPGTVVFHDFQYDLLNPDLNLKPAAVVLSRVVSHPRENWFTLDAGSKAIAAEAGDPMAYIIGHPEFEPGHPSEEHLPVDGRGYSLPKRGSPLYLVPRHVCPTVNLAEHALLMDRDESDRLVLRSLSSVDGRAHDTLLSQPLVSSRLVSSL